MSAKKRESVPRPVKTTEYTILFGTAQARKGRTHHPNQTK